MKNILYRADCKEALDRLINDGVRVDLIYLDPPFNSSRVYNMIYSGGKGKAATHKAFHDMWSLTSQNQQMVLQFETILDDIPDISQLVKDFLKAWIAPLKNGTVEDQKMVVYLIYMTQRLALMRRILKPTGSIYFHCDPTASHYIKIIMDGIFGKKNFVNEIVWHYNTGGKGKSHFLRKHDIILWYSKGANYIFNWKECSTPRAKGTAHLKNGKDENGREYYEDYSPRKSGKKYRWYLDQGTVPMDVWIDIQALNPMAKERLGYPTQKPLALLDRIIKASCPDGGIVLDPFCGCGTALISAIQNDKKWIGIDISYDALDIVKKRIKGVAFDSRTEFEEMDGSPETLIEYAKLNPFQKQDWLIQKMGGFPNPRKSGDGGVDGDVTIHLGLDKNGEDLWGKVVYSVKTGKQCNPAMIRELKGTMQDHEAVIGVLILDKDPSDIMDMAASKAGQIKYSYSKDLPPSCFDKVQIITSGEIMSGREVSMPPTMQGVMGYRRQNQQMSF